MSMDVEEMYQEIILDHYRAKHFSGLRDPYQAEVHHVNPSCGDEVTLRVHLTGGKIDDVSYDGQGCSISQASTSVMAGLVRDKSIDETLGLHDEFLAMMQSQGSVDSLGQNADELEDDLEDGIAFLGVAKFPARVKCALLGWSALKDAVIRAQADQGASQPNESEKVIS
ncbi:iron-sulfur cluster assembly scaffold protein NifU [Microlunatus endophyticus]|uniref:Iron-sulfur cluster assembly scaffold protein NifU n=2 Tax=Microlunatus endophyticus TaxID=1716077 RepID=A0A917W635_9ACTN|nr:iron-sulfur cluster assembly scaffold protein NifU [Microlunatus endophyticus]